MFHIKTKNDGKIGKLLICHMYYNLNRNIEWEYPMAVLIKHCQGREKLMLMGINIQNGQRDLYLTAGIGH